MTIYIVCISLRDCFYEKCLVFTELQLVRAILMEGILNWRNSEDLPSLVPNKLTNVPVAIRRLYFGSNPRSLISSKRRESKFLGILMHNKCLCFPQNRFLNLMFLVVAFFWWGSPISASRDG